ncbi:MAG TPA: molecular chaperone TorD family protein [Nitrososphaerales archaeon]
MEVFMRNDDENVKIAEGRSRVYKWLAQFFLMKPTFPSLTSALNDSIILAIENTVPDGRETLKWITEYSTNLGKEECEKLSIRYDELLNVPIPGKYVPPYESCFQDALYMQSISGYGELWGKATNLVNEFYLRNGFESTVEGVPPDHIGLELLFMANICKLESQAYSNNTQKTTDKLQKEQLTFLTEHIINWLPFFAEKIVKSDKNGFYSNIVKLSKTFIQSDLEYLNYSKKK